MAETVDNPSGMADAPKGDSVGGYLGQVTKPDTSALSAVLDGVKVLGPRFQVESALLSALKPDTNALFAVLDGLTRREIAARKASSTVTDLAEADLVPRPGDVGM